MTDYIRKMAINSWHAYFINQLNANHTLHSFVRHDTYISWLEWTKYSICVSNRISGLGYSGNFAKTILDTVVMYLCLRPNITPLHITLMMVINNYVCVTLHVCVSNSSMHSRCSSNHRGLSSAAATDTYRNTIVHCYYIIDYIRCIFHHQMNQYRGTWVSKCMCWKMDPEINWPLSHGVTNIWRKWPLSYVWQIFKKNIYAILVCWHPASLRRQANSGHGIIYVAHMFAFLEGKFPYACSASVSLEGIRCKYISMLPLNNYTCKWLTNGTQAHTHNQFRIFRNPWSRFNIKTVFIVLVRRYLYTEHPPSTVYIPVRSRKPKFQ